MDILAAEAELWHLIGADRGPLTPEERERLVELVDAVNEWRDKGGWMPTMAQIWDAYNARYGDEH